MSGGALDVVEQHQRLGLRPLGGPVHHTAIAEVLIEPQHPGAIELARGALQRGGAGPVVDDDRLEILYCRRQ
jgi:hypothetical protein